MATSMDRRESLRVLELYSGIGGMHWALKESGIPFQVVQAMDVNTSANKIYQHNFPQVPVSASSITKLTAKQLEKLCPGAILMSPPCQPFTRVGKKQDHEDPRSESFLHLMQLLRSISKKPQYILVENVKGFEVSETRRVLIEMLQDCDYVFQEFLLSPLQFGVPNARLRYYLVAKRRPASFGFQSSNKILEEVPPEARPWLRYRKSRTTEQITDLTDTGHKHKKHKGETTEIENVPACQNCMCDSANIHSSEKEQSSAASDACSNVRCKICLPDSDSAVSSESRLTDHISMADAGRNMRHCEEDDPLVCADGTCLQEYLESSREDSYFDQFLLSDKELRMFVVMDIVHPAYRKSACFTKRYGHYVEGAGSLLQMTDDVKAVQEASKFKSQAVEQKNRGQWGEEELLIIQKLKLRYFTPREVANLLCFPQEFGFPQEFSKIQCYRVLGNSLNVHVVSVLIQLMVM